ncbi:ABC transporter ATP-binding protein [Myxococcota bacterium]|nr:ABC transporter ATP-binding protein [Myxococcota bacterium]
MSEILCVEEVSKHFDTGAGRLEVLNDLSFSVDRGETVAIVGESGSGKSTLLSLLAGLDAPSRGTVRVAGCELETMGESELAAFRARELGIVFQQFHLMAGLSALENIALPLELQNASDALERARGALEQVGLADRANHLPSRLSGGECQRVAIARAMVVEPALLLADEPSGSIDVRTGRTVMNLLFDLVQRVEMTLVLVTHSQELAAACDRRLELVSGRLA